MAETQQITFTANGVTYTEYQPVLFLSEPGYAGDGVWLSGYALVRGVAISPAGAPIFLPRRRQERRLVQKLIAFYTDVAIRMVEICEAMWRWTFARKRTR